MQKYGSLINKSNFYFLLCEAGLREDMAKRIMYSILPSLSSTLQTHHTGGVVDYNALRYAVSGRHDIIKYGTRACVREMRHYGGSREIVTKANDFMKAKSYYEAIKLAVECFSDIDMWNQSYGGKAWEAIARSLSKIIIYDNELKKLQELKAKDPKALDQEVQVMQMLVIELNVFDGLSHNTASIMQNLIHQELAEQLPNKAYDDVSYEDIGDKYKQIENLMDTKELSNPLDVYKKIEPILTDSGDIHKYKDWTAKLRKDPQYRANSSTVLEFFKIRFRKNNLAYIRELNTEIDAMSEMMTESFKSQFKGKYYIGELAYSQAFERARNTVYSISLRLYDLVKEYEYQKENHPQDQSLTDILNIIVPISDAAMAAKKANTLSYDRLNARANRERSIVTSNTDPQIMAENLKEIRATADRELVAILNRCRTLAYMFDSI